jgi:hypothetical protein
MPDGYVVHLPPPKHQPHMLGPEVTVPADLSPTGHAQKEKTCLRCGAVRVTVLPKDEDARREWRLSADGPQLEWQAAPECRITEVS